MAKEKLTQSEIDGVQYRRAKLWQIILYARLCEIYGCGCRRDHYRISCVGRDH